MWKNIGQRSRPQIPIWHTHVACWIPKAINTHSEYVTLIAFPLQRWLQERASMLLSTYTACLLTVPVRLFVRSQNLVSSARLGRLQTYLLDGSFEGHAVFDEVFSESTLCH